MGRTQAQDTESLFDQLLELALRALAPSTNDPFTAIDCMNRIAASILAIDRRKLPSGFRANDAGELRLLVPPFDYPSLAGRVFSSLRAYAAADLLVATHVLSTLSRLRRELPRAEGDSRQANSASRAELDGILATEYQLLHASCKERLSDADFGSLSRRLAIQDS